MEKRTFLRNLAIAGLGSSGIWQNIDQLNLTFANHSDQELASNEDYWLKIRSGYKLKSDYINLENGYYCFIPQQTLNHLVEHIKEVNFQGSHYMRTVQWDNKKKVGNALAKVLGCGEDELILTRNTTESLDTIISGFDWKEGDEAVMAEQDYGAMLNQFKLVERRYKTKNNVVSVPLHPKSDSEIVELYANAITEKTRLLMVCHMINITGHILPIRKICDMAHSKGVDVMVDGAHAFAHIDFNIKDLDCDYYGTSLHKWLSAPLGCGMLYVKKGKAINIWPLMAEWGKEDDDIFKLGHTGTHPVYHDLSILNAIDYYLKIGPERKQARLRYLQRYWSEKVRNIPNILVNTPVEEHKSCGIANVGIRNMKPAELAKTLMDKYKIFTVAIDGHGVHGCRISPNVYTTTDELDVFVAALKEMAG